MRIIDFFADSFSTPFETLEFRGDFEKTFSEIFVFDRVKKVQRGIIILNNLITNSSSFPRGRLFCRFFTAMKNKNTSHINRRRPIEIRR